MVSAIIVGNTLLARAKAENKDITPMKLQKLIYCLYKEYYKKTGHPLFNERFEPWKYGPVLRSVYDTFKKYGSNSIRDLSCSADGNVYVVNQEHISFKKALDSIWEKYSDYDGLVLSAMTHKENTAWKKAIEHRKAYLSDTDIANEEDYIAN